MTQVFFDSPEIRRELLRLKTHALENIIDLSAGIPSDYIPVGDLPDFSVTNGNIRITYSIENQPEIGLCHHLSVSKAGKQPPNPQVMTLILEQLGMEKIENSLKVWLEEKYAVNIIQLLK